MDGITVGTISNRYLIYISSLSPGRVGQGPADGKFLDDSVEHDNNISTT